jgi:hypothetical protein
MMDNFSLSVDGIYYDSTEKSINTEAQRHGEKHGLE